MDVSTSKCPPPHHHISYLNVNSHLNVCYLQCVQNVLPSFFPLLNFPLCLFCCSPSGIENFPPQNLFCTSKAKEPLCLAKLASAYSFLPHFFLPAYFAHKMRPSSNKPLCLSWSMLSCITPLYYSLCSEIAICHSAGSLTSLIIF